MAVEAEREIRRRDLPSLHGSGVMFDLGDLYDSEVLLKGGEDFLFSYATCLEVDDAGSLARLSQCLSDLKDGATVVTINRPLLPIASSSDVNANFRLVEVLKGPNPEAEAEGMLSAAFVWEKREDR